MVGSRAWWLLAAGAAAAGLFLLLRRSKKQRLLDYLKRLPDRQDKRVVSGQFMGGGGIWGSPAPEVHSLTGKWLAMIGSRYWEAGKTSIPGFINWQGPNAHLIDHWNHGGLVTETMNVGAPGFARNGGSHHNRVDFAVLRDRSSAIYADFKDMLRITADGLQELKDAGVVVLLRPYQEMQYDWAWWGNNSRDDFVWLWRETYDYFVRERRLDNLLWWYNPGQESTQIMNRDWLFYYPGDDVVDIVGFTLYNAFDTGTLGRQVTAYNQLLTTGKPFGLGEVGPFTGSTQNPPAFYSFDCQKYTLRIREFFPRTVLVQVWEDMWGLHRQLNPQGFMDDPWVIDRDELPKL